MFLIGNICAAVEWNCGKELEDVEAHSTLGGREEGKMEMGK